MTSTNTMIGSTSQTERPSNPAAGAGRVVSMTDCTDHYGDGVTLTRTTDELDRPMYLLAYPTSAPEATTLAAVRNVPAGFEIYDVAYDPETGVHTHAYTQTSAGNGPAGFERSN